MNEDEENLNMLSDEELLLIQDEYRKQKLKETLIGPIISTCVHVALLVLCAVFFTGEVVKKNETVEITPVQEEIPQEEPPPPPPPPEIPPPEPQEVVSHDPQVTSDAVPDAADLVGAIDDVSDEPPSTDDSAESDLVNDIKPSASSVVSSKMFGGRSSAGRAGALKSYGGSVAAQQALHKALAWLAKVQKPDGSWGTKYQNALTGYALLVFLAHGETPKSKTYGKTVANAIQYLVDSSFDKGGKGVYAHALKTYALAEAYTMTGNYALEDILSKNAKVIIEGQQKDGAYMYGYKTDERDDMSATSWNVQALKALKATGLEFENLDKAIYKAVAYLHKKAPGKFTYSDEIKRDPNHGLMASGVLALQLLQETNKDTEKILNELKSNAVPLMDWNKPEKKDPFYRWYYITFAMFQKGGDHWKIWNNKFQDVLKKNQAPEGFWDNPGHSHAEGILTEQESFRVYNTCLASLMLTVYYRYLPSTSKKSDIKATKTPEQKKVAKEKAAGEEDIDIF